MMSQARFNGIWGGINGAGRKVYEAVPHKEVWTSQHICTALARASAPMGLNVVQGCLDLLVRSGLVKQSREGFVREPVRKPAARKTLADLNQLLEEGAAVAPTPEPQKAAMIPPKTPAPTNIVDVIGSLSQQVAAMAVRHQQELATLAGLVADAAIDVQHELEKMDSDAKAWRQVQALLKGSTA